MNFKHLITLPKDKFIMFFCAEHIFIKDLCKNTGWDNLDEYFEKFFKKFLTT